MKMERHMERWNEMEEEDSQKLRESAAERDMIRGV